MVFRRPARPLEPSVGLPTICFVTDPVAEHRNWLRTAYEASSASYDKAVMTLAGGALAISLTFIHEIAPHFRHKGYLGLAWASLALSLLVIFFSFWASQKALLSEMDKMDEGEAAEGKGFWVSTTGWLNLGAGVAFVAGVVFLVIFAWHNI